MVVSDQWLKTYAPQVWDDFSSLRLIVGLHSPTPMPHRILTPCTPTCPYLREKHGRRLPRCDEVILLEQPPRQLCSSNEVCSTNSSTSWSTNHSTIAVAPCLPYSPYWPNSLEGVSPNAGRLGRKIAQAKRLGRSGMAPACSPAFAQAFAQAFAHGNESAILVLAKKTGLTFT